MVRESSNKLEVLQAMRGVAALGVVFWHASRYFGPYGTGWAASVFQPGSTMGVDLFFLISGFIMTTITRNSDGSPKYVLRFAVARLARIWPPYLVATFLFVLLLPYRLAETAQPGGLWHLGSSMFFWPRASAGMEPPMFDTPILPVGWTLNYEIYFYLVFSVALLFGRRRWVAYTGLLLVTIVGIPVVLAPHAQLSLDPAHVNGLQGFLGLASNPIALLFAAGCLIRLIYDALPMVENAFVLRLSVFFCSALAFYQYSSWFRISHGLTNAGLSLAPAFLAFCVASRAGALRIPGWLVYLGDISYSLYIFHPLAQEGFDQLASLLGLPPGGVPAFGMTTALSICLAAISHRYLEFRVPKAVARLWHSHLSFESGATVAQVAK